MENAKIAFDILLYGKSEPRGYSRINCHMIFDIKIEDFRRKARLVAGGHMTETLKCQTYSSVVSRDTVRIAMTVSALDELEVEAGDIMFRTRSRMQIGRASYRDETAMTKADQTFVGANGRE